MPTKSWSTCFGDIMKTHNHCHFQLKPSVPDDLETDTKSTIRFHKCGSIYEAGKCPSKMKILVNNYRPAHTRDVQILQFPFEK